MLLMSFIKGCDTMLISILVFNHLSTRADFRTVCNNRIGTTSLKKVYNIRCIVIFLEMLYRYGYYTLFWNLPVFEYRVDLHGISIPKYSTCQRWFNQENSGNIFFNYLLTVYCVKFLTKMTRTWRSWNWNFRHLKFFFFRSKFLSA